MTTDTVSQILQILNAVAIFFIGATLASFLNLAVWRYINDGELSEILTGRSKCDSCNRKLAWFELVPVFSWIFLGGRCRKCKKFIPLLYPASEVFLGVLFVVFYFSGFEIVQYLGLLMLFFATLFDLKIQGVPKTLMNYMLGVSVIVLMIKLLTGAVGLIVLFELVLLLALLIGINAVKKAFGEADMIALVIIAAFSQELGLFQTFMVATVLGAMVSIVMLIIDRKNLKKTVPFLPFLFAGWLFTLFVHLL